jgi:hypothetical protein
MSWLEQLGGLLRQYTGGANQPPPDVHDHFDQVAQNAPAGALAGGIASAFRSDQTPPFPQMVGQLFGQSNSAQQAGLLNTLLQSAGPGVLQQVLGGGGLAGLLGGGGQVTPQQAAQIPPQAVQQIAAQAASQNPSVVDTVSNFYAQHPTLVKSLGAAAAAAVLGGLARQHFGGGAPGMGSVLPASQDPYGDPADQAGGQVLPASQDPYGDPADQYQGQQVLPASQDPMGDPADQYAGRQVLDASQDPLGDPADQFQGQQVLPASQDPYGDPADQQRQ